MDILPPSQSTATQPTLVKRHKRWATKVRSGCLTCRSRRVKCDETKPECQRCARVGRDCTGPGYSSSPSAAYSESTGILDYSSSTGNSPVHIQHLSPRLIIPLHGPSQVLSLDGSAAVRDLIYLLPQIPSYVTRSSTSAAESSLSEYILFRGEQLALFLGYTPPRLGHSDVLNSSINCVSSALHDLLVPPECRSPIKTFTLYAQALTALQTAIEDPIDSLSSETLCSTQLLSIFEFLARRGAKTSISHTQGMAQMVKLRGPSSFTTDFDRSLLISQTPFISANAAFRAQPCFLEHKSWQSAIRSAIMATPTNIDRSELRISMSDFTLPYSRLVGAAHRIIMHPRPETLLAQRQNVLNDVDMCREFATSWLQRHKHMLYPPATQLHFTELGVGDSLSTRTGYAITQTFFRILYNRLHVALGGPEALLLEQTTRDMAVSVLADPYVQQIAPSSSNIKMAFEAASAVLATTDDWHEHIESEEEPVTPQMWQTWLNLTEIRPE